MRYDFIEIGTSDFRTLIQTCDENSTGLSIDPLKFYLDRLPEKKNVTKVNLGISDRNSKSKVYWITPDNIEKYNLPKWIRGCNSIEKPHPTVINELSNRGLSTDIINIDEIELITFDTLIKKYKIESIEFLKIDTEGHDTKIIKSLLLSDSLILPKKIEFEANILSDKNDIDEVIEILKRYDYVITKRTESDIVVERNINKDSIIYNISSFDRKETLLKTIDSIFDQSDIINVSLNSYDEIPIELYDKKIRIFITDNEKGDAYKFIDLEKSNGYYFTIDDDIIYPSDYSKYLIEKVEEYNRGSIISLHGRSFNSFPIDSYYKSPGKRIHCLHELLNDEVVQFGGTGVMCFHTDLLKINLNYFELPNMADIWISKFAFENNIKIICAEHKKGFLKYQDEIVDTIYSSNSKDDRIQTDIVNHIFR
jgi:hypothetical protein